MEPYMISIDWLEVYCKSTDPDILDKADDITKISQGEYVLIDKCQPTATFLRSFNLLKRIENQYIQVASLLAKPRLPQISQRAVCVKISNRVLYSHAPIAELYQIVEVLKLTIEGITRLDLCYDCNRFAKGRNPLRFLKQYIAEDYGSRRYLYKRGSNEFRLYGKKRSNTETRINGLEFGSNESNYRSYIYDKTKELEVKKDKPWIREAWQRNGLISDENTHVYRAEITIKARGMDLLNMATGELFKLSPKFLQWQNKIESLFYIYAEKCLSFSVRGNAKKVRDFTPIQLFERKDDVTCKPANISRYKDTGRAEELAANTIRRAAEKYTNVASIYSNALRDAVAFLSVLAGQKEKLAFIRHSIDVARQTQRAEMADVLGLEYLAFSEALGRMYTDYTVPVVDANQTMTDTYTPAWCNTDSLELYWTMQESILDNMMPWTRERMDRTGSPSEEAEAAGKHVVRRKIVASNATLINEYESVRKKATAGQKNV